MLGAVPQDPEPPQGSPVTRQEEHRLEPHLTRCQNPTSFWQNGTNAGHAYLTSSPEMRVWTGATNTRLAPKMSSLFNSLWIQNTENLLIGQFFAAWSPDPKGNLLVGNWMQPIPMVRPEAVPKEQSDDATR